MTATREGRRYSPARFRVESCRKTIYKYLISLAVAAALAAATTGAAHASPGLDAFSSRPFLPFQAFVVSKPAARKIANPKPVVRPGSSVSLYERTVRRVTLRNQGCTAGRRNLNGVVILDFGKLASNGRTYGTILFSGRFAGNRSITLAMLAYAAGYNHCLAKGSHARISLARGTSNYHPGVPSAFAAGRKWAREVSTLAHWLYHLNLDEHVWSAAADDAEPAWDPRFHQTRDFFRGYRHTGIGKPLYNYGSLDGGIGAYWTATQAFYVSGGMRYSRAIPEIYNRAMAREWAELAAFVHRRLHRRVRFAGVMTQGTSTCHCSLRGPVAHRVLSSYLRASVGPAAPAVPRMVTNIRSDF
ncbi:MAG TPA: hypothetical protein VHD91_10185 [Gaiellaceae bacterium]|nr:hypothetical protein [Gaiellaceae bacterium]